MPNSAPQRAQPLDFHERFSLRSCLLQRDRPWKFPTLSRKGRNGLSHTPRACPQLFFSKSSLLHTSFPTVSLRALPYAA